jgi:endonuclease-3
MTNNNNDYIRKSCRNHRGSNKNNASTPQKVSKSVKVKVEPTIVTSSIVPKRKQTHQKVLHRPTPDECAYVTASLAQLHPEVVDKNNHRRKTLLESCGMRETITDSIISTMLSQNTTDANAKAAFSTLKQRFPDWQSVLDCAGDNIGKVEDAIKIAGLSKTRAERIIAMLSQVKAEQGTPSFEYIKELNDEEIKRELSRFKGIGPKTISCVLLFALGREEFPVDTHVLRITTKMGWVSSGSTREGAYEHLNGLVPKELKMDLHCLLVQHGKQCHNCASRNKPQFPPKDGSKLICPLRSVSQWNGIVPTDSVPLINIMAVKYDPDDIVKTEIHDDDVLPDKVLS